MSDSDERPDRDDPTMEALRREIVEAEARGEVVLSGPVTVQLMVRVEDALTPQEAVELVLRRWAHAGADAFTFAVSDPATGEDYFVQAGRLLDLDEVQAKYRAEVAST
jgi:hypothetical protein